MDSSGNFVIAWVSFGDGSGYGVYAKRYNAAGQELARPSGVPAGLGNEFRVNTYTTQRQSRPAAASDSSGNFVIIWRRRTQDGSGYGVFGQRHASTGEPLGDEFRVNTYTTGSQFKPAVASSASGHFVVVWQSNYQDGSDFGIFGQRYNMIVPVELMNFRVE